jgi:hypothetical protein
MAAQPSGQRHSVDCVVLAAVDLAGAAAAVLAIGVDEVAHLVDAAGIFVHQHFGGGHADIRRGVEGASQGRQKVRLRLRIVVQQGDEAAARGGKRLVVGGAESAVHRVGDHAGESPGGRRTPRGPYRAIHRASRYPPR